MPRETFYDGYVVNATMDAAYRSVQTKKWENIDLPIWRGRENVKYVSVSEKYDDE